jgi:hypothetical protein
MNNFSHNRVQLAVEQLHVAIDLFLSKRSFVSALTLAGAAEEILGRKAERLGKEKVISTQHKIISNLLDRSNRKMQSFKEYAKSKNVARNKVKHFDPESDEDFCMNIEREAIAKIGNACKNYERCGMPFTEKILEFNGWHLSEKYKD